ncbi:potassium channel family protein [Ornithinimicrobium flavum]|uniref:potassium channel family protein n=1 Tax=Ornithinimicrobium flavum TaxID=1288636 RepID=UPI00107018F0|nr:potassium channel family protein [Ornithinimicrobium flavum]
MGVVLTLAGVLLLLVGLHDMFHTLLHPTGQGALTRIVLAGTWRVSRATGHRLGSAVGPAAMVGVILMWVVLQILGWALVYLPHVPRGFLYASGIDPADYAEIAQALYLSAVTLTTLGYGDVVATDQWIRLATPLQALTGFALLTAALTWFMQIHPPLSRRRALALELKGLAHLGWADNLAELGVVTVSRMLDTTAAKVSKVRIDFAHNREGFYFQEDDHDLALARQLPYVLERLLVQVPPPVLTSILVIRFSPP